jgi:ASCH domain
MKILVVRQPWAWLIVQGYKDIENRSWRTRFRGPLLIQSAASIPTTEALAEARRRRVKLPANLETGGIIGMVKLIDCVETSRSKWFDDGYFGWVLSAARPLPFAPHKGRLGLFEADRRLLRRLGL